ncbi:MAG: hypothetical protein EAZ17_00320 [Sphingobacteriales bacterium]|nr:MAG: hypothetical protein EAZ17_00320 [Sphingobacteriales bacterium]
MNLAFKHLIPEDFDDSSRVWIYQSDRRFTMQEALQIEAMLDGFVEQWNTHGMPVKGFATMFFGQFIVLMADESAATVSGCSTDSSVRVIKSIEQTFQVSLFNRQLMCFVMKDNIQLLPLAQLSYAVEHGFVTRDTLYFNNTVQTKAELLEKWMIPAGNSWLIGKFAQQPA